MPGFDDEEFFRPAKPLRAEILHDIGQNLDTLSLEELNDRIDLLRKEIARLETAKASKETSLRSAASFFKS